MSTPSPLTDTGSELPAAAAAAVPDGPAPALYLHIDSGNHQGARIELEEGQALTIGSVLDADIYLTDAGVAPLHATVERVGDSARWHAMEAEISMFGIALPPQKSQLLRSNAEVAIGAVTMSVAGAERDAEQALRAQRVLLRQRAPWRYVLFEWRRLESPLRLGLIGAVVALALLGAILSHQHPGPTVESTEELASHIGQMFPHVKVALDEQRAAVIYSGYVERQQDLERLRLQAWNISTDIPLIQVFAMSEVMAASRTYLGRLYRSVDLRITGPGTLAAQVPADAPARSLDAWDFEAVATAAQRSIPGLRQLSIEAVSTELKQSQSIPLEQLGLNLVSGPSVAYLRGRNGEQLFSGAVLKEGTLLKIEPCKILLHPRGSDLVYRLVNMEISDAHCR